MDIQILFFDIDGTLISKEYPRLRPELLQALRKLQQRGIKICIATGRHSSEIDELGIAEDFPFDAFVTLNGNYCYSADALIFSNAIPREDVSACLDYVQTHHLPCMFVEARELYISHIDAAVEAAQESIHTDLPPVGDIARAAYNPIYQIVPYFPHEQVRQMLENMGSCKATRWHPLAMDIVRKDGGKHRGVQAVLDYYNLKPEQAMVFGDGENDIDMLSHAVHAVVMGNADDHVKQHGAFITRSVNDLGVLHALAHYGLLKEEELP